MTKSVTRVGTFEVFVYTFSKPSPNPLLRQYIYIYIYIYKHMYTMRKFFSLVTTRGKGLHARRD